ncbi:MAG: ABC transporter ATP-binding protein [Nitrososphaerales archaeon]
MKVIESRGIGKGFSNVVALDGLSFGVENGAITGLIGPNGAGKTTAIKIMLGLLRPDKGSVLVFGERPWSNRRVAERVGVVLEKPHFPFGMKVEDYLSRIARMHGYPSSKALDDLKRVGLAEVRDRRIGKLSAGMLQKFSLVHALINEPELVIADEPTSNLDPQVRNEVLGLIVSLNKEKGTTFLISSHVLPELSRVCDTAVIISKGKLVGSGNLQDLYRSFGAEVARITTDSPGNLAEAIRSLAYVISVEVSGENLVVETNQDAAEGQIYVDVPRLAAQVHARLYGIESKNASLEELFKKAVSSDHAKGGEAA